MLFGDLPLEEAEGAILAHSLKLPGTMFRKGRVLSAEDIAVLADAGQTTVTAAKLGPEDVGEDLAAARIARAVMGPGLTASAAYTGRVNLYAAADGVLLLDTARLERVNLLDESLTIATLPAYAPVMAGQMVATVKIIPFATPLSALDQVEALARDGGPPVALAGWRGVKAGLIQTVLSGTRPAMLDKTVEATRQRLAGVGATLVTEMRVPHDPGSVAEAVGALADAGCDLLLLIGASAITDRRDVLPAGIERAGGTIEHFGMPVDPGNLLLLARLGDRPVLGLPGCARSPKLNGFDWVLQRLAAGIEVSRGDIMRMGVGGLLTEISSRPLPRESISRHAATEPPRAPRIAALILAAGLSRRMGANKLLATVGGRPLVSHAVAAAIASQADPVLLVTGHEADRVRAAVTEGPVTFVHAADHAAGLSASLKAGLSALPDDLDGVVVLLADMPRVTSGHIDRLIAAYSPIDGRGICIATHRGRRGNPVLWDRRYVEEMLDLTGDTGAKALFTTHADQVCEVEMPDDGVLLDVDTPEALAAMRPIS